MVTVVVFEFGVMRCQPLRRALGFLTLDMLQVIEYTKIVFNCWDLSKNYGYIG